MKSIVINILILLLPTISYGQVAQTQDKSKLIEHNISPPKVIANVYVKIDTLKIKLDTLSIKLINPNWIRKIEVIKREEEKNIFGNSNPIVMIYPKRKFKKEILIVLNKK